MSVWGSQVKEKTMPVLRDTEARFNSSLCPLFRSPSEGANPHPNAVCPQHSAKITICQVADILSAKKKYTLHLPRQRVHDKV